MKGFTDTAGYREALNYTKGWCLKRYDPLKKKESLRSEILEPSIDIRDTALQDEELFEEISRINELKRQQPQTCFEGGIRGKVLYFRPDESLGDGLVALECGGFIDSEECPPWDTWFYFIKSGLESRVVLSWIPEEAVKLVDRALEVDQYDCLGWVD